MSKSKTLLSEIEAIDPADAKRKLDRIKTLEKHLELAKERISSLERKRWTIPLQRRTRKGTKGWVRVAIPDTHGCLANPPAIKALLDDLDFLAPREVVWLGDHLECGGFLAEHHTLGYVAQTEYTFKDDCDATNHLLDEVQSRSRGAEHHYIEGNHERRIEKWIVTQTVKNKKDAEFLRQMFGANHQLHLAKRKINYYPQGRFHGDCRIPATIKLGHCYFTHGSTTCKHAAAKMLEKFGSCVVFGHIHRIQQASSTKVEDGTLSAWCPGCLCEIQPLWRDTDPTDWAHGYGVQLVQSDGSFLHINVPIIDGRSYLVQFTDRIGRHRRAG